MRAAGRFIRGTLAWLRRLLAPCLRASDREVQGAVEVDAALTVRTAQGELRLQDRASAVRATDTRPRLGVNLVLSEVAPERLLAALARAGAVRGVALAEAGDAAGRRA